MIEASVIPYVATRTNGGPFIINPAILHSQFDEVSHLFLSLAVDEYNINKIRELQVNAPFPTTLVVPSRFVSALGSPVPIVTLIGALETYLSVPAGSVENVKVSQIFCSRSMSFTSFAVSAHLKLKLVVHGYLHVWQRLHHQQPDSF